MTDKYDAEDIVKDLNEGKTTDAATHLHKDFMNMTPEQFNQVVKDMEQQTAGDDNSWNNVTAERDGDGNVTAVYVDDGFLYDSKIFDKKAYESTPLKDPVSVWHGILGGLDMGKKDTNE